MGKAKQPKSKGSRAFVAVNDETGEAVPVRTEPKGGYTNATAKFVITIIEERGLQNWTLFRLTQAQCRGLSKEAKDLGEHVRKIGKAVYQVREGKGGTPDTRIEIEPEGATKIEFSGQEDDESLLL